MPLYEFECPDCGHRVEEIRKFNDPFVPICQHGDPKAYDENRATPMVKVLSRGTSFILKGKGWYKTDYSNKK